MDIPFLSGYQQQDQINRAAENQGFARIGQLLQMQQAQQGMQKGALELSVLQDQIGRQKRIRDSLLAAGGQPQGQTAGAQMNASAGRLLADRLNKTADIYEQNGEFDAAMKIREHAQKLLPELKDEQVRMGPEGKPVVVRNYKDGTTEVSPFAPADKLHFADAGGVAAVGFDPYTGKPITQGIAKTQTPDSIASNAVALRGQNMVDARAREAMTKPQFHDGSWVAPPQAMAPGQVVNVPGINKPLTEFQGKSASYGSRAAVAHEILNAVGENGSIQPGLIKRTLEATPMIGEGLGTLANATQSPQQQQVEQAQRDFVNAVLRQESGAAISESEFNNARKQYFPQPGDSPDVIAQKRRNRETAIQGFATSSGPQGQKIISGSKEKMQTIFEAQKAIKLGADKQAVKQRLEAAGITDHGIK